MKGRIVALDHVGGQPAAALVVDGRVEDLFLPPRDPDLVAPGTIFRAIADRPLKGQGGMMLRLGDGLTGFLRGAKAMRPGQSLLVQVTGYAEPGKALPVTSRLLFKSRYAIVTPDAPGRNISRRIKDDDARDMLDELAAEGMAGSDAGLILRSVAATADPDVIADDIRDTRNLAETVLGDSDGTLPERLLDGPDAHQLAWRDWEAPDLLADQDDSFADYGVDEQIAGFANAHVDLKGQGDAWIEPTRALVAIDVNTGGDTSPAAALKANLALARDLPRQLRCRGLGGQVVIDFAPMPKGNRRQLETDLRAALRRDSIETSIAGWTQLGHLELQRKRERLPLSRVIQP